MVNKQSTESINYGSKEIPKFLSRTRNLLMASLLLHGSVLGLSSQFRDRTKQVINIQAPLNGLGFVEFQRRVPGLRVFSNQEIENLESFNPQVEVFEKLPESNEVTVDADSTSLSNEAVEEPKFTHTPKELELIERSRGIKKIYNEHFAELIYDKYSKKMLSLNSTGFVLAHAVFDFLVYQELATRIYDEKMSLNSAPQQFNMLKSFLYRKVWQYKKSLTATNLQQSIKDLNQLLLNTRY